MAKLPHDFITHREAWRKAIEHIANRCALNELPDDAAYWEHELRAFDRAYEQLLSSQVETD